MKYRKSEAGGETMKIGLPNQRRRFESKVAVFELSCTPATLRAYTFQKQSMYCTYSCVCACACVNTWRNGRDPETSEKFALRAVFGIAALWGNQEIADGRASGTFFREEM